MADLVLTGLQEALGRLSALPANLVKNSLRSGLRQGANIVRDAAKANFDGAGGPNDVTGVLKESIRTANRRGSPTRVVFNVVAGTLTAGQVSRLKKSFAKTKGAPLTAAESSSIDTNAGYYALWVEQGHINRRLGDALKGSRAHVRAARAASASNTPAYPYMAPALASHAQTALDAVVASIEAGLQTDLS